jgi:formylglycine-generating enzyme required for sulfatase activity
VRHIRTQWALIALILMFAVTTVSAQDYKWVNDETAEPIVERMLDPTDVDDAEADDEDEMEPYTEVIEGSSATFDMVPIPGGEFLMGSPEDEEGRNDDEGPQVEVEIEPFWMGVHEVTWDEYAEFHEYLVNKRRELEKRDATDYDELAEALTRPTPPYTDMTFGMGKDGFPAICMTQLSAKMYCKWLTARTGRYYRLPTEAEWEYACRAGTDTTYYFGDDVDDLGDHAWYFDNAEDGYQKVGQLEANPWGLYDMHGNVSEWCLDGYTEDLEDFEEPFTIPTEEFNRVVRGGSWYDLAESLRCASRSNADATAPSCKEWKAQDPQIPQSIWWLTDAIYIGMRVVRPLETPDEDDAILYEPDPQIIEDYKIAQGGKE